MTAAKPEGAPVSTADPFSLENLAEPHALHEQLREAGPLVRLDYYGIWGMALYEQVNAALKDWETFSSAAGAGLSDFRKEKPWRTPSLLLEADPPAHTRAREVVGPIMSPPALRALRGSFEREAIELIPSPGIPLTDLAQAASLASYSDETHECKSVVAFSRQITVSDEPGADLDPIAFSAHTRMSGVHAGPAPARPPGGAARGPARHGHTRGARPAVGSALRPVETGGPAGRGRLRLLPG